MEPSSVPSVNIRVGWVEAFNEMVVAGDDKLLIDATLDIDEDWV